MHDCVAVKARKNIRNKLETFGLLLSRNKVTLYTLRQLPGCHYQLVDVMLPWFDDTFVDLGLQLLMGVGVAIAVDEVRLEVEKDE
ncbi:hypothetical protein BGX24_000174 [Mortierella sp. AD032]|nr:hypothetical protein BGX24_000174 [Mortierella sp. AD032]